MGFCRKTISLAKTPRAMTESDRMGVLCWLKTGSSCVQDRSYALCEIGTGDGLLQKDNFIGEDAPCDDRVRSHGSPMLAKNWEFLRPGPLVRFVRDRHRRWAFAERQFHWRRRPVR